MRKTKSQIGQIQSVQATQLKQETYKKLLSHIGGFEKPNFRTRNKSATKLRSLTNNKQTIDYYNEHPGLQKSYKSLRMSSNSIQKQKTVISRAILT